MPPYWESQPQVCEESYLLFLFGSTVNVTAKVFVRLVRHLFEFSNPSGV